MSEQLLNRGSIMNYSASMKQYIDNDITAKTSNTNPHSIIIEKCYRELKKNMETLAYSIDNEPISFFY